MDAIQSHPFLFQALVSLFILVFIAKLFSRSARNKNLPSSPRGLPVFGNLLQLGPLPHRDLLSMAKEHGPLMLLHFGRVPTLVVSSADGAREIMKTHDLNFADRPDSSVNRRLLYDNKDIAVAPYGEYWRQLKKVCVLQLLSNKRVLSFHAIRQEETEIMMKKITESSGCVDLSQMFTQLTYDVVCRSAMGRKYGEEDEEGQRFLSTLKEFVHLLGTIIIGEFVPLLSWTTRVNGFDARVERVAREMDEFLEGVIRERLQNPPAKNSDADSFVDILLDIYRNDSAGVSIDRDNIKAIILDAFAAGTDTTSTVLEWAMSEVLRQPSVLKKLKNEVCEVMGERRDITADDLERMHYLKAIMKETLRCHPPIPLLVPRVAKEDVKIMEYDIAAGTRVIINAWAIGRDPNSWEEPERFNPDRFLNSEVDFKGLDFELIPFGAGRRGCPGVAFAMATNEFVLASLIHRFEWKLPEECKELDMNERPGLAIKRAVPLLAVGI